jgi:energy-coupling factor transport system ATP-binding protein
MIRVEDFSTPQTSGTWTETHSCISAGPGQTISIVGPSASGKTALCLLVCGLASGVKVRGRATVDGRDIASLRDEERAAITAYVPTDPSLLFSGIKSTLRGEFELAWQLLSPVCDFSQENIAQAVAVFGLDDLLDRDPFTLSGGESARAAVALALAKKPSLIAIDQGYDNLDPDAVHEIRQAIARLLPESAIVFETFSRRPGWLQAAGDASHDLDPDAVMPEVASGAWRIHARSRKSERAMAGAVFPRSCGTKKFAQQVTCHSATEGGLLQVRGLAFEYLESSFRLGPLDLDIGPGERVALLGPNGVGKTTLLKCLAMLVQPTYRVFAVDLTDGRTASPPKPAQIHRWASNVLYCFQNPDDQIYLPTVRDEIFETARRVGNLDIDRALSIAVHLGLAPFLDGAPSELPRSFRRLVCIASALAAGTPMLLLDEPSAGLDDMQTRMLAEALLKFRPARSACIMVSHDEEFIAMSANRILKMANVSDDPRQTRRPHFDPMCATHS